MNRIDPVNIRPASINDAHEIAALITQLGYLTSREQMEKRLEAIKTRPGYQSFVAEIKNDVVGSAGLGIEHFYERDGLCGRLLALVVDESFRGAGIGSALVQTAEAWFASQGARLVILTSRYARQEAHRFYKQLGYVDTGIRLVKELEARP
jgi:GNAT superfamily N-acetyltransferase